MEKFSVKKPFTILVAVIMVLLLGFVSITNLQTNLLPDISTPYLMVVTVYPGASPERVESEVSDVMENALGTVSGVESITATSAENYSLLLMKFAEGTDMNSAMVKTSNKVDQTASSLPGTCLTPSIIEYSLNMNAFMTVAVSREGSDVYDLSDFVDNTLVPYVGRTGGVSSVSANGLIEKMVQVQLNQDKIDEVNARLLELIDTQLADARAQLDDAEAQIAAGRAEYEKQLKNFGNTVSDTVMAQMGTEVADAVTVVRDQAQALLSSINQLIGVVNEPEIQQALIDVRDGLQRVVDQFNQTGMRDIDSLIEIVGELRDITDKLTSALQELQGRLGTSDGTVSDLADELEVSNSLSTIYKTLDEVIKAMDNVPGLMNQFSVALGSYSSQQLSAYMQFTEAREKLKDYENQLEDAKQLYEETKEKALASADVAKQLDIKTLAQLIYAQNFSMPAGYVADKSGESWLLKVGEEYDSVSDIEGALLLHVEGFGDVRLSDVADVAVIDNAEASYTRLNGERAVVLKIFRNANSSASSVSDGCLNAFKELQAQYSDLHVVVLSNQGNYITIIVNSIISSMLVGAALAIIVLAIFLKDIKPTLVVGVSIPLSVLFAVVLMYFTGLDMNIMTLAGLSLSRAEGLIVALAFIGILWIEILRTADGGAGRRIWRAVWSAGAVFLFTAVLLSPRLYQVWSYCGYPVTDARMVGVLDPVFNPERAQAFADGERKAVENVPADGIEDDDKKSGVAERFIDCLEDQSRGLYEVYLPFTLLGLILLIMRRAWRREYSYMLLLIGLNFVLFYISVSSYRYYTVALPLAMVFTVYGGAEVAVWVRKFRLVWVAVVLLAVLAVFPAA